MNRFSFLRISRQDAGSIIWIVSAILLLAGFRVLRAGLLPELPNFSPVAAVAFCGGLFLPGMLAWIVPFGILFVSDVSLAVLLGYPVWSPAQCVSWVGFLAIVGIGRWVSRIRFSMARFFISLIASGLIFYILTNSASWLGNPLYPRDLSGLWMALTTGLPGYPPSWVFYRNSMVSDLLFGGILLAVWMFAKRGFVESARIRKA